MPRALRKEVLGALLDMQQTGQAEPTADFT
jgi:hypothetical protein